MKLFPFTVATVDSTVFDGKVRFVTCPGSEGELTILAEHTSLVTTLKKGELLIQPESGEQQKISIERGLLEISADQATVLL